jgi:acyl-CoA thioesterase-1
MVVYHTASAGDKTPASILVIGDSLSGAWGINVDEGWVALLQRQITAAGYAYNVINASVSGDTTRTGLGRVAPALQVHKPAIVIIALGGNDGLRGLDFSEIESSLAGIIELSLKSNARVLLTGVRLPPNYGPVYNEQFAALYRRLSDRYGIPLVPRMLDQVADYRDLLQDDGIHPTAAAQPAIMLNVWSGLEPLLQEAGPDATGQ